MKNAVRWLLASILILSAQTALASPQAQPTAAPATLPITTGIVPEGNGTCYVTSAGAVRCWGVDADGTLGDGAVGDSLVPTNVVGLSGPVAQLTAGDNFYCAVLTTSAVQCWGYNIEGQLGNGTRDPSGVAVTVPGLSGVVKLVAGENHVCVLLATHGLKCWGGNGLGQAGIGGAQIYYLSPVDVPGLTSGVADVVAGYANTCALLTNGGLKCWGDNTNGHLGAGYQQGLSYTPIDVVGLQSGVKQVTMAEQYACALLVSGGVKCWGDNSSDQLGDGFAGLYVDTPVDVVGLQSGVQKLYDGDTHTCALLDTHTVKCWGSNTYGMLGDGTQASRLAPVTPTGLGSAVTDLSLGLQFSCARLATGGLKCWGANDVGQTGTGLPGATVLVPTNVSGLTSGVTTLFQTHYGNYICAQPASGTVKCWGDNFYGTLGDGSKTARFTPVDVVGLFSTSANIATSGGQLTTLDNAVFDFASGDFSAGVTTTYTVGFPATFPPAGVKFAVRLYDLYAALPNGTAASLAPAHTYTVTIHYTDAERGGAIESSLKLYSWNGSQWVVEPTSQVNGVSNTLTATPSHLSQWAVLGDTLRAFLPVVLR